MTFTDGATSVSFRHYQPVTPGQISVLAADETGPGGCRFGFDSFLDTQERQFELKLNDAERANLETFFVAVRAAALTWTLTDAIGGNRTVRFADSSLDIEEYGPGAYRCRVNLLEVL